MTNNHASIETGTRYTHKETGIFWFYSTDNAAAVPFVVHLYNRHSLKPVARCQFRSDAKRGEWVAQYIANRMGHDTRKVGLRIENAGTILTPEHILCGAQHFKRSNAGYYTALARRGANRHPLQMAAS